MARRPSVKATDASGQEPDAQISRADLERQLALLERKKLALNARNSLLEFTKMTMPDPADPDDVHATRYKPARHHEVLAAALEAAERGEMPRLIVCMPPRGGKSELVSRRFLAWYLGRDPYRSAIFATYNEDFAMEFGRDVRTIIRSPQYQQIFPGVEIAKGASAANQFRLTFNGLSAGGARFSGTGGSLTGRGGHVLVLDDPFKDREEADSPTLREKVWSWFTQVFMTRQMPGAVVVVVMTRWHEDDIVGRLTDPENPCYDPDEAAQWRIINFPMEAEERDPLGRQPGELLWPERFGPEFVASQKRLDPRGYMALYQQRPTPEDGSFFRRDWIVQYTARELPKNLRVYAASDHAVGAKQTNDRTAMLVVGVDEQDDIWVLDAVWDRLPADKQVDEMIRLMKKHQPIIWWAEKGHISKSIGPFLKKRMFEEKVYGTVVHEETPTADKQARAQSIAGRMSMKKVRFPRHAPWLASAISEMMKFPLGAHDDFVDALAWIGLGLRTQVKASKAPPPPRLAPRTGTIAWIKWDAKRRAELARAGRATQAGW